MTAAAAPGLTPLCASSTAVGVAGYTLGGGMGPLGRRYGFAADHVHRLRLVTADGRPHEIDADRAPELFWALRGAGARGFGVVTELEFALFPIARLYGGGIFLPGAAAADCCTLAAMGTDTARRGRDVGGAAARPRDPPPPRRCTSGRWSTCVHRGRRRRLAEADALLAPLRAVATPLHDDVGERPVTDVDAVHRHSRHPTPVDEGGVVLRELPAEAVDALLAAAGPTCPRRWTWWSCGRSAARWSVRRRCATSSPDAARRGRCGCGARWCRGGPGVSGVPRGSGDRDVPDEIRGAGRRDAGDWRAGALVPGRGAAELRGRGTARGTLVARRPSAAAVQQAVDPDGMFARTPLP